MTLAEFKAWLEGFEHSFTSVETVMWPNPVADAKYVEGFPQVKRPNGYDWLLIKEKLALVGSPVVPLAKLQSDKEAADRQQALDHYKRLYDVGTQLPGPGYTSISATSGFGNGKAA